MKTLFNCKLMFILTCILVISSCKNNQKKDQGSEEVKPEVSQDSSDTPESGVIEIVTNAMEFKTQDEFPSGWNTFRYKNKSNETHLILFDKYPEGKTIEDTRKDIIPPFQEGMDFIKEGKLEEAGVAFGKLPEWFQDIEFVGGVGLISPNTTAESTLYLEPGTYIIECYVKMPNGVFHTTMGMAKQIEVVEEDSGISAPDPDHTISISAEDGITFNDQVSAGEKTFAVNFGEQKIHENYLMHDVNLVWVEEGADMTMLTDWVNWAAPEGLQTPAPGGFKFLGGMQEMNPGKTGYFTADLKPGNYVLISEVPDARTKGLFKSFTVN